MSTAKPRPGQVEIRDSRTQKLVCRYDPRTGEVEVSQRGEVRRGTLPKDPQRVVDYAEIAQREEA
jgi:hypothetical protein